MRTVRLPSQFDDPRRQASVATPSCSCCCCCLVTTVTGTTLAAVYVNERARARGVPPGARAGLCLAAIVGLALAVIGLLATVLGVATGEPQGMTFGPFGLLLGVGLLAVARAGSPSVTPSDIRVTVAAVLTAGGLFTVEVGTLGFLIVGQVLAIPVPLAAGYFLRRRMRRRT